MFCELNKESLISLVTSINPIYDLIPKYQFLNLGKYTSGLGDHWEWNKSILNEISEENLWEIYKETNDARCTLLEKLKVKV